MKMKNTVWDLFVSTGNTGYYRLYKKLDDGSDNKGRDTESGKLQGK